MADDLQEIENTRSSHPNPVWSFLRDVIGTVILAAAVFLLLETSVQSFIVSGPSMENTLENGQRLLIMRSNVAYAFSSPDRGEVTVFQPPGNKQEDYIKRIIGLPGDTVEVKNSRVYVNGIPLVEPYIKEPPRYSFARLTVPENSFFVLGDNRNNSNDSHSGWTVPRGNLVGRAWITIWPPDRWGTFSKYSLSEQVNGSSQK